MVQHAAAFQYMVDKFVKEDRDLTEGLIKDTHAILVRGLSAAEAGCTNSVPFAGVYRQQHAGADAVQMTKPSEIPTAMKSMVATLREDLADIEKLGKIDPFILAAKYCDRFVNIHPFKDGNGRLCRLILNAILIKYAGIAISLGEQSHDRDGYLQIAQESTNVGGHHGQLRTLILTKAGEAFTQILKSLRKKESGQK